MEKDDGIPYAFEDFIQENNGCKNDGDEKVQGVLAFAESCEKDGGFCLVPGFHKNLHEWCSILKETEYYTSNKKRYFMVEVPPGTYQPSFVTHLQRTHYTIY